ncbi:MAG: aldehyde dehydrogenase family protein, partial [Eubacteriales bacterium]|nr:aldehyde dehydrogenase family protein [Eubacteriales bacterium]
IAQNEIFGPVLCIERFSNIEEALKIANDTKYGLAGYAFTTDLSKALRVAKEIEAGNICINGIFSGHNYITGEPFKQSGFGLSSGVDGMRAYMKQKIVNINWKAEKMGFFD